MKKILSVLTAVSMLFCSCTPDKKPQAKVYSRYYSIHGSSDYSYSMGLLEDGKLDDILNNYDTEYAEYYSFEDDNFEIYRVVDLGVRGINIYSGKFEKDSDNVLNFNYDKVVVEIPQKYYDEELEEEVKQRNPRIREVLIDEEYGDIRFYTTRQEKLKKYNETNSFIGFAFTPLFTRTSSGDLSYDTAYFCLPQFEFVTIPWDRNPGDKYIENLDKILDGKFICTETYGVEVEGEYSYGKPFKLVYNPINTFLQSPLRAPYVYVDKLELICKFIGADVGDVYDKRKIIGRKNSPDARAEYYKDYEVLTSYEHRTTLSFDDGYFTWENQKGKELLRGRYEESKDYPGLIVLKRFIVSTTRGNIYDNVYHNRLFIYISESGEIFTPHYIALNQFN